MEGELFTESTQNILPPNSIFLNTQTSLAPLQILKNFEQHESHQEAHHKCGTYTAHARNAQWVHIHIKLWYADLMIVVAPSESKPAHLHTPYWPKSRSLCFQLLP